MLRNAPHIPGCVNLVGDGFSRKDEDLPHVNGDGSSWSVCPDWEHARGLHYDLFTVGTTVNTTHSILQDHFKEENVFLEVVDALLRITGASSDADCKQAAHRSEGYFIDSVSLDPEDKDSKHYIPSLHDN